MWTEFASMPTVEQWRRGVSDGELLAPRVLAAGAIVNGGPGSWAPNMLEVTTAAEARDASIPIAGHSPLQVRALEAARAGQRTNEHLSQVREACTQIEDQLIEERQ